MPESRKGFLLNHLIHELLPKGDGLRWANSDPVTGQAAWYDLKVNIEKARMSLPLSSLISHRSNHLLACRRATRCCVMASILLLLIKPGENDDNPAATI